MFFVHLKFSIFGYFSCHNGSKNALISGHSTSFGISSRVCKKPEKTRPNPTRKLEGHQGLDQK